jgi:hypothetical protein
LFFELSVKMIFSVYIVFFFLGLNIIINLFTIFLHSFLIKNSEKDILQISLNSSLGEQDDLKKRILNQQTINKTLTETNSNNLTTAKEQEVRKLQEQATMEETRLNELRKSFEKRCLTLIEDKTKNSENYDDRISKLKIALNDMKSKGT